MSSDAPLKGCVVCGKARLSNSPLCMTCEKRMHLDRHCDAPISGGRAQVAVRDFYRVPRISKDVEQND